MPDNRCYRRSAAQLVALDQGHGYLRHSPPQVDFIGDEVHDGPDGTVIEFGALIRLDTAIEVDYYKHGGILPYVLREMVIGDR